MDFPTLLQYADRAGFVFALVAFLAALYARKLRWGRDYTDLEEECAECSASLKAVNEKALAKLERLEQLAELDRARRP